MPSTSEDSTPEATSFEKKLADHIVAQATQHGVRAEVKINAIPPHIAGNILEFLRRVRCEGVEAIAWVEAYGFMQQHVPQQGQTQGVPFNGLPTK